jgi:tRNA (cmo5U34)-methyltransferase
MKNKIIIESGDGIKVENASWKFSGDVVNIFDKHIKSSVPLYKEGHDIIAELSDFFLAEQSICYEIGSSTGTLIRKIANRHKDKKKAKFIGLEIEKDMINKSIKNGIEDNLSFLNKDIVTYKLDTCDMVVSYYTIQFIHPKFRQDVINNIYNSLNWGGVFVFFEKVRASDARFQDITTSLYTEYKLSNGYSSEEIIGKARSLKGVLEPFSTQGNVDMLKRAGFSDILTIMKYVSFEGFIAIK